MQPQPQHEEGIGGRRGSQCGGESHHGTLSIVRMRVDEALRHCRWREDEMFSKLNTLMAPCANYCSQEGKLRMSGGRLV
jgi:hypothetical protein